jgi:hypothetical protein
MIFILKRMLGAQFFLYNCCSPDYPQRGIIRVGCWSRKFLELRAVNMERKLLQRKSYVVSILFYLVCRFL